MQNFVQKGDTLTLTAPADIKSGEGLLVGAIFGVAAFDATSGNPVEVATTGVFVLPKVTGTAFTEGATLYWDAGNARLTTNASGNTKVGAAALAAASADASCSVWLPKIVA